MGDNTAIEWTDASWTPIRARNRATGKVGWHCTHASEGCRNCYAEGLNHRLGTGLPFKPGHEKDVEIFLDETMLLQPLRWKRPRMIFVCSMTDLFADFVPDDWIDRIFAVMALAPQHTFQVLTKRSKRMREYLTSNERTGDFQPMMRIIEVARKIRPGDLYNMTDWPLPNVWLGVSTEDQARANERIPDLLATPAAVRFVSAEPLLGPIDLETAWHGESALEAECWGECGWCDSGKPPLHNCQRGMGDWERGRDGVDWVIAGGESGPHSRPMHPDWARGLRDQCAAAGVPFFFKQWGEWSPVEILDEDEDGRLGPAYPMEGCTVAAAHKGEQECVFWQGDDLAHWPRVEMVPAIGARRVGKRAAGRLLDGRTHDDMPKALA